MDKKIPLENIKQGLLNRFENDFQSLTIAAYLKAQEQKLSKEEQDEFVISVIKDARRRFSQNIIDMDDGLFL